MINQHDYLLKDSYQTVIIGGGQSGLAAGYYLSRLNEDYLILDAEANTGDSWRGRWKSLRLFTPAWVNEMPGMGFPGTKDHFATKDEVADFLISYKEKFSLPVLYNARVTGLYQTGSGFRICVGEKVFQARSVIVATGNYAKPKIPALAGQLRSSINQLHSSQYMDPSALPEGDVLVVGAGTSGLQIALDLIKQGRGVSVSGTPPFHIPDFLFKYFSKQFVWFTKRILNTSTPIGRKAALKIKAGGAAPLINISLPEVEKAGAECLSRITSVSDGWPVTETGEKLRFSNIIWATGFNMDYSWIGLPDLADENGCPLTNRGVSLVHKGLYFVGSLFQYGLTSTWIGGVGRDANYVAQHVHEYNQRKVPKLTESRRQIV